MNNHITFVDLDETLFYTFSKVFVKKDGEITKALTNKEFNTYKLQDGEEFDFSQFKSSEIFDKSIPINSIIEFTLKEHEMNEVAILTARSDFINKDLFLKKLKSTGLKIGHYKDGLIHVIRCGNLGMNSSSIAKKITIKEILKIRKDVKSITVIDDDECNLRMINELSTEFNVKIKLYLVKDGEMFEYNCK